MSVVPSESQTKVVRSTDLSNKVATVFQTWATLARVEEIQRAIGADPAPVLRLAMPGPVRAVRRGATPS